MSLLDTFLAGSSNGLDSMAPPPLDVQTAPAQEGWGQNDKPLDPSHPLHPAASLPSIRIGAPLTGQKAPPPQTADEARRAKAEADIAEIKAQQARVSGGIDIPPPPGDPSKTGEDYLSTLPHGMAPTVRAMLDGRMAPPSSFALKTPYWQQMLSAANQADPAFDQSLWQSRVVTRKNYESQTRTSPSMAITSLNTLAAHLNNLYENHLNMAGPDLGPASSLAAGLAQSFDQKYTPAYNNEIGFVQSELQKLLTGTTSVTEGDRLVNNLKAAQSSSARLSAIKAIVELAQGRIGPLRQGWHAVFGDKSMPTDLTPSSMAVFDNILSEGKRGLPVDRFGTPTIPPGMPDTAGPDVSSEVPQGTPTLGAPHTSTTAKTVPLTPAQMQVMSQVGAMFSQGAPDSQILDALKQGFNGAPPDPAALDLLRQRADPNSQVSRWIKQNPGVPYPFMPSVTMPLTGGEQDRATDADSKIGSFMAGAASVPLDITQLGARAIGQSDYADELQHKRDMSAANNPVASFAGDMIGTVAPTMALEAGLAKVGSKIPGAVGDFIGSARTADAISGAGQGALAHPEDPLGGAVAGGALNVGAGAVGRGTAATVAPTAGKMAPLYEAGVNTITPGQRVGGAVDSVEKSLMHIPIAGNLVRGARQTARNDFQIGAFNSALKDIDGIGGAAGSLPKSMKPGTDPHGFAQTQFERAYTDARSDMRFVKDSEFDAAKQSLMDEVDNGALTADSTTRFKNIVDNFERRLQNDRMTGEEFGAAASALNKRISALRNSPSGDHELAAALADYSSMADEAARRASPPEAVAKLDKVDQGYAKLVRLETASKSVEDPGTFTPKQYAAAVRQTAGGRGTRSKAYLRGEALGQDYANAGLRLGDQAAEAPSLTGEGGMTGLIGASTALSPGAVTIPLGLAALYAPGLRKVLSAAASPRTSTLAKIMGQGVGRTAQGGIMTPYLHSKRKR